MPQKQPERLSQPQKQAQKQIFEAAPDSWRRIVLENALDAVIGMNQDDIVIEWNRQSEVIFGWTKDQALGRKLSELIIPPDRRSSHHAGLEQFLKTGHGTILNRRIEVEALHRNGSLFPVELTVIPIRLEGSFAFYSFVRDISERKGFQNRLKLERDQADQARYRVEFLSQATKILLAGPSGFESRMEKLARHAVPFLGDGCRIDLIEKGDLIREVTSVVSNPDVATKSSTDAFKISARVMRSGKAERLKGSEFGELICLPLIARGQTVGALTLHLVGPRELDVKGLQIAEELASRAAFAIDNARLLAEANAEIARRGEIEKALRRSEADLQEAVRTRDEFLTIASHELKTPMTTLKLQTQIALLRLERNDRAFFDRGNLARLLESISKQIDRLSHLVEDMLDISRIMHRKLFTNPEAVDLGLLVHDVVERLSEQLTASGSPVRMELESGVVGNWDRYRIEQVVINLLTNAMKYGLGNPIDLAVSRQDGHACLQVRDHGMGISATDLERVFDRFERAISAHSISGLGLGLYISRQIVEIHQGRIWAESVQGRGSTFFVELPT